ncbi:hypothetical protein BDV25DRAFT_140208 [Aspergillus avenaceus]|uniref:RRM domain-containing protein n=1 Tax=Aspergillus avenaceus TaxID=36643 RepID=A0A5N6TUQ5_ASPAV|nr:hypothetical protein BDV25DRAFT_140208 [Aspergillus avenaceus]
MDIRGPNDPFAGRGLLGTTQSRMPQTSAFEDPFFSPDSTPTPAPRTLHGQRPRSHNTQLHAPVARVPPPWEHLNAPDPVIEGPPTPVQIQREMTFDRVALTEEMPIGSNIQIRQPPKWGVIRISNEIPYAITKQEIIQFVGREARLIPVEKGCAIHIIMERSTAKTMDCFVEFETVANADQVVKKINRVAETGRPPRLGNRQVDVVLSNQDDLLKEMFPRAKCISWRDGVPVELPNTDRYSTGFNGFFTSEEIFCAIRHTEVPHRSPFSVKCPQRAFESTISTLYKFPWYATAMYTVDNRNQLFEMTNRQIMALVARMKKSNTVGLDQRLLKNLLYAGLNCPAFNERQKYTLCTNTEEVNEISKFPIIGKWFPFDTLVKMPRFDMNTFLFYADLISRGEVLEHKLPELENKFPLERTDLRSPFGRIWFEWPVHVARTLTWNHAVSLEMSLLGHLVLTGWVDKDNCLRAAGIPVMPAFPRGHAPRHSLNLPAEPAMPSLVYRPSSRIDVYATPARRPNAPAIYTSPEPTIDEKAWNESQYLYPTNKAKEGFPGHRNTKSSPDNFIKAPGN